MVLLGKWKVESGKRKKHVLESNHANGKIPIRKLTGLSTSDKIRGQNLSGNISFSTIHFPLSAFCLLVVLSTFYFPLSTFLSSAEGATYYLDYQNGADNNNGSTWALAKKTINGYTAAIIAPGDTIRMAKSPDPTSLGITATWTNLSKTVTLASALTANVYLCESAWTGSPNVTMTTNSNRKEGASSSGFTFAAGFTTGLAAYKTITSADFSGYQQLSFWVKATTANVTSGTLRVDLCSDTAGATPVDSFTINQTLYVNQWYPFTIDKGSALGSAIQSVALYCILDPGAPTVYLDDIITVKASSSADSLSLTSLIGKNTAGETWYGIKSINGTTVEIDNDVNNQTGGGRGYAGTTETVTTYKRETIKTTIASSTGTSVQTIQDSGSSGSLITYSGGWNTATTTQDGETWFDGQNGYGFGINFNNQTYDKLEKVGIVRYYYGLYLFSNTGNQFSSVTSNHNSYGFNSQTGGSGLVYSSITANNNATHGFSNSATTRGDTFTTITANNNASYGLVFNSSSSAVSTIVTKNNGSGGCQMEGPNSVFSSITSTNNGAYGLYLSPQAVNDIYSNCTFSSNTTSDLFVPSSYYGNSNVYFFNCLFSSTTELTTSTSVFHKSHVYSQRHDQTAGRFKTWQFYNTGSSSGLAGIISDQITGGQTAAWARGGSGTCVYLDPQQTAAERELSLEFWIPITASTSTTVSFYHKITASFNGSLKITVYDSDDNLTKLIDAAAVTLTDNGAWNQYTSSAFTPTDTGFCRIVLEALNGAATGDIGIDDVTISPDPDVNQGAMDRWMQGLPPEYMTDATETVTATEQSYGYVN